MLSCKIYCTCISAIQIKSVLSVSIGSDYPSKNEEFYARRFILPPCSINVLPLQSKRGA